MARLDANLKSKSKADVSKFVAFTVRRSQDKRLMLLHLDEEDHWVDMECVGRIDVIRETIGGAEKAKDAVIRVDVNIYGPRSAKRTIGKSLSSKRMYLQTPDWTSRNIPYENPHMLDLPDLDSPTQMDQDDSSYTDDKENGTDNKNQQNPGGFQKTVKQLYASLTRAHQLGQVEGGKQIRTHLLPHQKKALNFMIGRESGNIPDEYRLWKWEKVAEDECFVHSITESRRRTQQDERGGGILADEMGMGKSLSTLGLIVNTLEDAKTWQMQVEPGEMIPKTKCAATLILVPSEMLINGWYHEVLRHLDGTLNIVKYHGPKRRRQKANYKHVDIVITTYDTLRVEFEAKNSTLHEYEWYRVVLDEAHIIRRQATWYYRSVNDLKAYSRWCLTGTPIQNQLEDIGTLFAWLRIHPFDSLAVFRRFIVIPFHESEARRKTAIRSLTMLLDSVCLRRTKDLLDIPGRTDRIRQLDLTPAERSQYNRTKNRMIRAIKQDPGETEMRSRLGMFQAELQLRILCNHGTWEHDFSWASRSIRDEQEGSLTNVDSDEIIQCSGCRQPMPVDGRNKSYDTYVGKCAHILCAECLETDTTQQAQNSTAALRCPLCIAVGVTAEKTVRGSFAASRETREKSFRQKGHSSKVQALVEDVKQDVQSSKSIIFTCWTRTLDLIALYLLQESIPFERIDGKCLPAKRQEILNNFAEENSVPVLIMTTGTGAIGLNLTAANRVFIVEPQWNPSVENQAIARAIRLGQGREVQVVKYLIKDTVEQKMRSLQEHKLALAEFLE